MKQLVLGFLIATCLQLTINAQSTPTNQGFKTNIESPELTINKLYKPQQLLNLETVAPEILNEIKCFFLTWNALSTTVKSQLNKRAMYGLYIRDHDTFGAKLTQITD
ncbi:MAG: hypothetical protein ACI84C_000267 [Flavobacteriales bacterium]|jgi:hypothetical protein